MRLWLTLAVALGVAAGSARSAGLLIPEDRKLPPLAMVNHAVKTSIEDQVAVTTVEQTFRNHTDRPLEATYLFPVPKGASVNKFTMWVDGKETAGELLDAKKASDVYTAIVRRIQDPGLLEYLGNNLLRLRVFPVPPKGDQKVKLSYTAVAAQDAGLVEYVYPMKTDGKATRTLDAFSVSISIKSQHPIQTVYSPTHAVRVKRNGDREVAVEFEKDQALLDKDFQLFYGVGNQDIGLTPILYKPVSSEDGYFLLLVSPQLAASKANRVPRDFVLVLDTSGSMSDLKMSQAKKALKFCLDNLGEKDRFGVVAFATTVRTYRDELTTASGEQVEKARKWVDDLRQGGGTAIQPALAAAVAMRANDPGRSFTMVFFTDGQPTVDETNPDAIVKNFVAKNSADTRVFTFGVGDDVNATMLDRLADATRGVSTYVRPAEDIEAKVSGLHAKISHPVMTNVRLTATNVTLHEVYPPQLPDLFHGGQLVVIGRYAGQGPAAVKLAGKVGAESRELVYELTFPSKTDDGKGFVEHLWARRKVGYLLDQIRVNGEKKELVDEATVLAKRYGIATPYTSYLVVPDGPMPVAEAGRSRAPAAPGGFGPAPGFGGMPAGGSGTGGGIAGAGSPPTAASPQKVQDFAKRAAAAPPCGSGDGGAAAKGGEVAAARAEVQNKAIDESLKNIRGERRAESLEKALTKAKEDAEQLNRARDNYRGGNVAANQAGKLGVDLSVASQNLRFQQQLSLTASQVANGRNCVEVGGVWIDDRFEAKAKMVVVKAQSDAYFRILAKQPGMKDVYRLGNHLVWVAPSGAALVVDSNDGVETLPDDEIDKLFAAAKK